MKNKVSNEEYYRKLCEFARGERYGYEKCFGIVNDYFIDLGNDKKSIQFIGYQMYSDLEALRKRGILPKVFLNILK